MTTATVADGAPPGYRPTATLTFLTELRRQAGRRRTQLALGFMVALPVVILLRSSSAGRTVAAGAAAAGGSSPSWRTSRRPGV